MNDSQQPIGGGPRKIGLAPRVGTSVVVSPQFPEYPALGLKEVKQKALAVLTSRADLKTSQILKEMEPPRPSSEQLRLALIQLAADGEIQRDPPMSEEARGKTHRWRKAA